MKPEISCSSTSLPVLFAAIVITSLGCKASQLSSGGTTVALLYDEPVGCENLGVVVGRGGGISGAYAKPSVNQESAENDARNKAAELGATHLLLHPEEVWQGDGRGPDYQDTAPELAHGSGTGSTVSVNATAFKCASATPQTKTAMSIASGTTFVAVKEPTSISFAPLGTLRSVVVFHRVPDPSGTREDEVLVVDDQAEVQRVAGSLDKVVEDPMKFIPTHRVEFVGELGTQSLLYGFGYLQYAGKVYRLTNGVFEEALRLRAAPKGPEVELEPPPAEPPTEAEAP